MDTPTPTQSHKELPNDGWMGASSNPFADPDEDSVRIVESPRDGIMPNDAVIMDPVQTPPAGDGNALGLQLSGSLSPPPITRKQPGPPQPLRLPSPKTPPPVSESSRTSVSTTPELSYDEEPVRSKWWTEWLCGCSEGPDRGGDNQVSQDPKLFARSSLKYDGQAGRTNPFE
jgi:hypothetical protein